MGRNNQHTKEFSDTGSSITFGHPEYARGRGCEVVILNDAAWMRDMENHWKTIFPVLSCGAKCFVLSCVNNHKPFNWFEDTYKGAVKNENWFHVHETDYRDNPAYSDPAYCLQMREALGEEGWQTEVLTNIILKPSA